LVLSAGQTCTFVVLDMFNLFQRVIERTIFYRLYLSTIECKYKMQHLVLRQLY